MAIIKNYPQLLIACSVFMACSQQTPQNSPEPVEVIIKNQVSLNSDQIARAGIKIGSFEKHLVSDIIECNGSVEADPNNQAMVSPAMKGYVRSIKVHIGDYVAKGDVLARLAHPDYITLQQEYLEIKSQHDYYKEDFKRQGELSMEEATSIKTMQQAQNEFRKTEARLFAYKHRLAFLGINPDSLHVEEIRTEISLISPISGYVTSINIHLGMLCQEEVPIFQIVSQRNALLHLKVFEKDAPNVKPGQNIHFSLLNDPSKVYNARLITATQSIDENNTINIHARISNPDHSLMPGMYVTAKIYLKSDSVFALNNEAIINTQDKHFIFERIDSTTFLSYEVITGRSMKDKTEILSISDKLRDSEIVVEGAYYLYSELTSEE